MKNMASLSSTLGLLLLLPFIHLSAASNGPAFSTGPVGNNSWIREATATLIVPPAPNPVVGNTVLWVGMGTDLGDLIQGINNNYPADTLRDACSNLGGNWCVAAYALEKTGANSQRTLTTTLAQSSSNLTYGISQSLYDRLDAMAILVMSAYVSDTCPSPGGLPKVAELTNVTTDTHAYVVRNDSSQSIITVFRGTDSLQNYASDMNYTLANFDTFPECQGCQVHGGYYLLWESILEQVNSTLQAQAAEYPDYEMVITGHSLGGSLASLAAAQFSLTPTLNTSLTLYTFGQPRTGNPAYASYMSSHFTTTSNSTTKSYRVTHTDDGVPQLPPLDLGYLHHGLEYWTLDPPAANDTVICGSGGGLVGEMGECNEGTGTGEEGINAAHLTYLGHTVGVGAVCA
ncbi:MAG: hypothetical protein Q9227_000231 [Pyrenula ochraceoflavens]